MPFRKNQGDQEPDLQICELVSGQQCSFWRSSLAASAVQVQDLRTATMVGGLKTVNGNEVAAAALMKPLASGRQDGLFSCQVHSL
jgi:hypothetical protein